MELFFIILLVLASVVGMTFIVERGLALRRHKVIPKELETALTHPGKTTDPARIKILAEHHESPLSRLILLADSHREWPRSENVEALQTSARREVSRLERGLVVLEIIIGIAPLLGLVGTVYGLITLFAAMGQTGFANNSQLAEGIATALNATLLGLLTAIPSLAAWSFYSKKVETLAIEMESFCEEFLRLHYNQSPTTKTIATRRD